MFRSFEEAGYAPGGSPRKGRRKAAKKPATPKPAPRLPKPAPIQARPAVVASPTAPPPAPDSPEALETQLGALLAKAQPLARKLGNVEVRRSVEHAICLLAGIDSTYRLVEAGKETV